MATILAGRATAAQLIGFVVALRAKGETADELSGLLDAVLAAAELVPLGDDLRARAVDVVGTGGDRSHSINVSTMAAHRRRRRRRAGLQARRPRRVVAVRHGRRARGARRGHRAVAGRRAALRRGGRHRLLLRPPLPPGVPLRRPGPPGDRHPDRVQPARPDGQPGPGPAPADRRRRRPLRRADAGVAAGPRLDRRVGRARRRARRADDDRPVDGARARPRRRRAHVHGRPGRARPGPGDARAARRRRSRRTTPTSCAACSAASAAPTATSSCSTPPPRSSSPARPATSRAGVAIGRAVDRRRQGGRRRSTRWCGCRRTPPRRDHGPGAGVVGQPRARVRRARHGAVAVRRDRRRRRPGAAARSHWSTSGTRPTSRSGAAAGTGELWVRSPIPIGRGLGFSGAMRVGGLCRRRPSAPAGPVDSPPSRPAVLELAVELEGHADNVAASLYGGVVATAAGRSCRVPLALDAGRRRRGSRRTATSTQRSRHGAAGDGVVRRRRVQRRPHGAARRRARRRRRRGAAHGDRGPPAPGPPVRRRPAVARGPRRRARGRRVVRLAVGQRSDRRPAVPTRPTPTAIAAALPVRRPHQGASRIAPEARRRSGSDADLCRAERAASNVQAEAAGEDEGFVGEGAGEGATGVGCGRAAAPGARRRSSRRRGRRRGGPGRSTHVTSPRRDLEAPAARRSSIGRCA